VCQNCNRQVLGTLQLVLPVLIDHRQHLIALLQRCSYHLSTYLHCGRRRYVIAAARAACRLESLLPPGAGTATSITVACVTALGGSPPARKSILSSLLSGAGAGRCKGIALQWMAQELPGRLRVMSLRHDTCCTTPLGRFGAATVATTEVQTLGSITRRPRISTQLREPSRNPKWQGPSRKHGQNSNSKFNRDVLALFQYGPFPIRSVHTVAYTFGSVLGISLQGVMRR